jgi:hypothetical protein
LGGLIRLKVRSCMIVRRHNDEKRPITIDEMDYWIYEVVLISERFIRGGRGKIKYVRWPGRLLSNITSFTPLSLL